MMKDFNKGITLIALVVTIIVLLILAGVSISMLTGQNGILNRAQEAKEKTEVAQEDENEKIKGYENIMSKYAENLPQGEGTTPYLPNSSFSYKEGNLNTGLVIEDANNNEYVWVEVPKTIYENEKYNSNGTNKPNNSTEIKKIEACLKEYTNDYKDTSCSDTNTIYATQYEKMLKSVYENGGFWIGRYEAGNEKEFRTEYTAIAQNDMAVIKPNVYPYNFVTRDDAQELATRMNYENCTSSLIFGIQWDLTLKYIDNKNVTDKTNLIEDSMPIGNYYDKLWNITNKLVKYSTGLDNGFYECPYQKQSSANVLLTTGANTDFSLMNIYDLAGNVWEWTLEFCTTSRPCVYRGGSCSGKGLSYPVKYRGGSDISNSYGDLGFRIGLWN